MSVLRLKSAPARRSGAITFVSLLLLASLATPSAAGLSPDGASGDVVSTTTQLTVTPHSLYADAAKFAMTATVKPVPDGGFVRMSVWSGPDFDHQYLTDLRPVDSSTGEAKLTTELSPGTYQISAAFMGTPYFVPSTANTVTVHALLHPTTISVALPTPHVNAGQNFSVSVTVPSGPTGRFDLSSDGEPFATYPYFSPGPTTRVLGPFSLPGGFHAIRAHFRPGGQTPYFAESDSDPEVQTVGDAAAGPVSISLDYGRSTTNLTSAVVGIGAAPPDRTISEVELSNQSDLGNSQTFSGASAVDWQLAAGPDGSQTVYAQFTYDDATTSAIASDSILLDRTPPTGTFVIDGDAATMGDPWNNSNAFNRDLSMNVTDDSLGSGGAIDRVAMSNDGSQWSYQVVPDGTDPADFTEDWAVGYDFGGSNDPNGPTLVYAKWRDSAGNWSSVATDTIDVIAFAQVSTTLVDGLRGINDGGDGYTGNTTVLVTVQMAHMPTEGIDKIKVWAHSGVPNPPKKVIDWGSDPHATTMQFSWSLVDADYNETSGDGLKRIFIDFVSATGRTQRGGTIVILDRIVPGSSAPGAAFALGSTVDESTSTASSGIAIGADIVWAGHDNEKVAAYRLQRSVDASEWASIPLSKPTAISTSQTLAQGKDYRYRGRAIDAAGNPGAWKIGPVLAMTVGQDDSPAMTYHGNWTTQHRADAFGGTLHTATAVGAYAKVHFTGRAFAWVTPKSVHGDTVAVYVDGKFVKNVNLDVSVGYHPRRVVFSIAWAAVGSHRIKFVKIYSGPNLPMDGFLVLS